MKDIIRINQEVLKKYQKDKEKFVRTYTDKSSLVQNLYWSRLRKMLNILNIVSKESVVLDIGCGEGVFLPSLNKHFKNVYGIDLDIDIAEKIKSDYKLENIKLFQRNIFDNKFHDDYFDIIYAASVLEHFDDTELIIQEIYRLLKPGGKLIFSSPTETGLYELGRKVFGYVKPEDHYHSVFEIAEIASKYFSLQKLETGPFKLLPKQLAVYVIYAFEK